LKIWREGLIFGFDNENPCFLKRDLHFRVYFLFKIHLTCLRAGELVAHTCNPSLLKRQRLGESRFKASSGQIVRETLLQKNHHKKGLAGCLKHETLSSNPSATRKCILGLLEIC
jgi:hypothetical protein